MCLHCLPKKGFCTVSTAYVWATNVQQVQHVLLRLARLPGSKVDRLEAAAQASAIRAAAGQVLVLILPLPYPILGSTTACQLGASIPNAP